jgi:hypothetical protein
MCSKCDYCDYEHSLEIVGLTDEPTDSEKLEFLYQTAVKADKLMSEIGPQLVPMLEGIAKNPMLKMFMK